MEQVTANQESHSVQVDPHFMVENSPQPIKKERPRKILLVEDDPAMVSIFETILSTIVDRVQMDFTPDGDYAIEKIKLQPSSLKDSKYDLIIADIFLDSDATGIDLFKETQGVDPRIPVVITSSLPFHKYIEMMKGALCTPPYLAKPFKAGECRQMLNGILNYHTPH